MKLRMLILWGGIICLLFAHGVFQVWLTRHENQTIDEGVHISAGISYLRTGDFRLNPEHPPLAKIIAAVPVELFLHPNLPIQSESWSIAEQWEFAREFMYRSGNNPDVILLFGRIPIIVMTVLLGWFCVRWAKMLSGWLGAYVVAILFATFPIFLAHGHLITTDIPVTLAATAGAFYIYRWAKSSQTSYFVFSSVLFAISANLKFTGVMLSVIACISVFLVIKNASRNLIGWAHPIIAWLGICFGATLLIAFITTGGSFSKFSDDPYHGQRHMQKATERIIESSGLERFVLQSYRGILEHVPFPAYSYVNGLLMFLQHTEGGHESYFYGTYSDKGSVWYFPASLILKSPMSMIICITLLFFVFVKKSIHTWKFSLISTLFTRKLFLWFRSFSPEGIILALFPILYLGFSMLSHVNIGVRHITPIFPFILLGIATLLSTQLVRQKIFSTIICCILAINLLPIFLIYPFPMAYFSEIIGGSSQGYRYLLDSNVDWGQNLKYLKRYMTQNNIPSFCISYFGQGSFSYEKIVVQNLPASPSAEESRPLECVAAISVQSLYSRDNAYKWLRPYEPIAVIGYGIYLYDFRTPN